MSLSLGLGLALTRNKGGADALHGVQVQAARSPGRTFFRNGLRRSTALTDVATVTRATQAWGVDQGGNVSAFAAGQPVVTTAGLAVYEQSANAVRNPSGAGLTTGSPGIWPTNWSSGSDAALGTVTRTINGSGVEYGLDYVEARFQFTATAGGRVFVAFDGGAPFAPGPASMSWGFRVVSVGAGALSDYRVGGNIPFFDTGSTLLGEAFQTLVPPTMAFMPMKYEGLTAPAGTAKASPRVSLQVVQAGTYDITVRFYTGQLEQKAFSTPPIRQGAATRNADVVTEAVDIRPGQDFTILAKFVVPPGAHTNYPNVFKLDNQVAGQPDNLVLFVSSPGTDVNIAHVSAGVSNPGATAFTSGAGMTVAVAIAVQGGVLRWSLNKGAVKTLNLAGGAFSTAFTRLALGSNTGGTQQLNSLIRDFSIVMRAYSDAELLAASDITLTHDIDFVSQVYQYVGAPYVTPTDLPGTTFSRATEALNPDAAGQWYAFASGALRVTSAGCFFGEGTTNKCTNYNAAPPALLGPSTAATFNSAITNMQAGGDANARFSVVDDTAALRAAGFGALIDAGKLNGRVYKIDNSLGSSSAQVLCYSTATTLVPIAVSAFVAGGSGSVGVHLGSGPSASFAASSAYQRCVALGTPTNTGAAPRVVAYAGQVVYFILNQFEERTYATSPVIVAGASATRNVDVLASANDNNPSAYTVVAEFSIPVTGPDFGRVWNWGDGTTTNRARLYFDRTSSRLIVSVVTGGVQVAFLDLGVVTPGSSLKVAAAFAASDFAAVRTGGSVVTGSSGTPPAASVFSVGSAENGGAQFGGPIKRIRRWNVRKTNSELQALVA